MDGLIMNQTETDIIAVRLEPGTFGKLSFSCYRNGRRLSAFSTDIPEKLRSLSRKSCSYESLEDDLGEFFRKNSESVVIELMINRIVYQFNWVQECPFTLKTKIGIQLDGYEIDRAVLKDAQEVPEVYAVGERYLADINNKILTIMPEDHTAWQFWKGIDLNPKKKPQTVTVPFISKVSKPKKIEQKRFNLEISESLIPIKGEDLWIPGKEKLDVKEGEYVLEFQPNEDGDGYNLSFLLVTDTDYIPLSVPVSTTLEDLPKPLRDPVRARLLLQKMFSIPSDDFDAVESLEPVTLKPLTAREKRQFSDWRNKIWKHYTRLEPTIMAAKGSVLSLKRDAQNERKIWLLMIEELRTVIDHFLDQGYLAINQSQFNQSFEALKSQMEDLGGSVRMNDKPIELQDWSVELNVDSTADGYTLTPEIYKNGEKITQVDWDTLIRTQGIFELEDRVEVIPPQTLETVKKLLGKVEDGSKVTASKKNHLEIPKLEILEWLQLSSYGITVNLPEEDKQLFARLLGENPVDKVSVSDKFKGSLRQYQEEAYQWLTFLYQHKFGACLADDMGLGKTIQAIAFLTALEDGTIKKSSSAIGLPSLIVVPPSLVYNWESELKTFGPHLNTRLVINQQMLGMSKEDKVLITTYECVRRNLEWFLDKNFDVIVFDEAQLVKNLTAARTHAVRQLNGQFKLALTGTPMENHLGEYFAIMDLVVPGLLGAYTAFQQRIRLGDVDGLLRRTKPFILRRTKEAILEELPDKTESVANLPLSKSQKETYSAILEEVQQSVKSAFEKETENKARMLALTAILRLRQLCVHPSLVDPGITEPSPKEEYLVEQLSALRYEGHHALVFTQFRQFLAIMEKALTEAGIPFLKMDGTTPVKKRKELVEKFQNSDEPIVFLMTLKTGGVGLNLTRASYVFHADPWWNPAVEEQASDRIHRIGQTKNVFITRLVMHGSIEDKMMKLKERKQTLFDSVMKEGAKDHATSGLTREEIAYLIGEAEELD